MMMRSVRIGGLAVGQGHPLLVVAGPCVLEEDGLVLDLARFLKAETEKIGLSFVFKASYDKANRSSLHSFRGPGLSHGLALLRRVREEVGVPVLSDVHSVAEVEAAAEVLDVLQIPAFLCRQTDLLVAAARTGRPVNLKKGQFMAPGDMAHAAEKITAQGNENLFITERGTTFGYHNLVVDMRALPMMRALGFPVIFDATHSVQLPGGAGGSSGGQAEYAAPLARAAVAAGVDGVFMEVHPNPAAARCDGPNSLPQDRFPGLIRLLKEIDLLVREAKDLQGGLP